MLLWCNGVSLSDCCSKQHENSWRPIMQPGIADTEGKFDGIKAQLRCGELHSHRWVLKRCQLMKPSRGRCPVGILWKDNPQWLWQQLDFAHTSRVCVSSYKLLSHLLDVTRSVTRPTVSLWPRRCPTGAATASVVVNDLLLIYSNQPSETGFSFTLKWQIKGAKRKPTNVWHICFSQLSEYLLIHFHLMIHQLINSLLQLWPPRALLLFPPLFWKAPAFHGSNTFFSMFLIHSVSLCFLFMLLMYLNM